MADKKIPDLTALSTVASGDTLYIMDVSDTTDSSDGTSKKITKANLVTGLATTDITDITSTFTELNALDGIPATLTATELGYVDGVTSAIQTQMDLKATLASPTFTGTVVIPTPFTLGAVSVLPTGTELNFVDGVTSAIQTQLNTKAPIASPNFTGTVSHDTVDAVTADTPITYNNGTNQVPATYTPAGAATATLDVSNTNIHRITCPAGDFTIAVSNETVGQIFLIEIIKDNSATVRTITWMSTVDWITSGGTEPTFTTTANGMTTYGFRVTAADSYEGYLVGSK